MKQTNDMYYSRTMSQKLEAIILKDFQWLIDAVIQNPELDFQTGSNDTDTWFSVYRGTGRILTINERGRVYADKKYIALHPDFYSNANARGMQVLLSKIQADQSLGRYYVSSDGKKKEGFYQNLISRRYSLFRYPEDDFIIIDKEFVLGYKDDKIKSDIIKPVNDKYDRIIQTLATKYDWFRNVKQPGTECDFVGLNRHGDILLLELKRYEDSRKIYLSPIQAGKYDDLTKIYAGRYFADLCRDVLSMVSQKVRMGLLRPQWELPSPLSGRIIPAVVVGGNTSTEAQRRFVIVRDSVGKDIPLYTCDNEGTLIRQI